MGGLTIEQQRAIAIASARLRLQQQQQKPAAKPVDPAVAQRRAELNAEEKAARDKLARATKQAEEYRNTFIGKALAAPYRLFGAKSTSEERLEEFGQDTKETIDRINRERAFLEKQGRVAPKPTAGQRVTGALKAIPRGAIEGGTQFLGALGIGGGEGEQAARRMEQRGKNAVKALGLEASEVNEFDPLQRNLEAFGGGLGSLVPYVAAEVVGKKAAPVFKAAPYVARGAQALLGTGQGATQARQQMDDYEQQTGQKIDPTTRKLVQAGGATIGLSELLPIGRMIDTLPPSARAAATSRISNILTQTGANKLAPEAARTAIRETLQAVESKAVGRIATRGFAPEALQEGGTQLAQNVLAATAYNPNQDLMEGVAENAILGGLTGATVSGSFEAANFLGERAAANRQKAIDMAAQKPLATVELGVRQKDDPTQVTRERVSILSAPDANGEVTVLRPDGTLSRMTTADIDRLRIPDEGPRATPLPETFSKTAIGERLMGALGNAQPDDSVSTFIKNVNTRLSNALATANPEEVETFIKSQSRALKRAKVSEDEKIARMLVLDEAKKVHDDYLELLTAPPEGTAPAAPTAAAPEPTPSIADELASQAEEQQAELQKRNELLNQAINSPDVNKLGAFEDLMTAHGFQPNAQETSTIRDYMRQESDLETTAGTVNDIRDRELEVARMNIIEPTLYDPAIKGQNKTKKINADLKRKGLEPLTREELNRVYGYEAAEDVFGPEGEYQRKLDAEEAAAAEEAAKVAQKRDVAFKRIANNPAIKDKYRAFIELADKNGWNGPDEQEMAVLRGDAAEIESLIRSPDDRTAEPVAEPEAIDEEDDMLPPPPMDEDEEADFIPAPEFAEDTEQDVEEASVEDEFDEDAYFEEHPLMQEHNTRYDEAIDELGYIDNLKDLRALMNRYKRDGLIDAEDYADLSARMKEITDREERLDEGLAGLEELLDNQRENQREDVTERIRETDINELNAPEPVAEQEQEAPVAEEPAPEPEPEPEEAFVQYSDDGAAFSADISPEMQGVLLDWKRMLLPGAKVYFSTYADARANAGRFGPKEKIVGREARKKGNDGVAISFNDGEHYILFEPVASKAKTLEVIAHEMGHVHEKETFRNAPPEERQALVAEHERWLEAQKGKDARGLLEALRARRMGRAVVANSDEQSLALPSEAIEKGFPESKRYWKSFSEWYADQTARWAVSDAKPTTIVEKYFSRLGKALRSFYQTLRGQKYLPTETFKKFLEKTLVDLDLTPTQAEGVTYDDVLNEVEGAFMADPTESKPQEISEQNYRLLKQAAENQRATPEELMAKLEEFKDRYAEENGFGEARAARDRIEAPALPDGPASSPRQPRIETQGFAANLQQRIKRMGSAIIRKVNYKYQDAVDYSKALASIYGVTKLPDNMNVANKFALLESRKIGNQMSLNRWYIDPLENKIKELELDPQDVGMFLLARSAKDRNALVAKRTSGEVLDGSGITNAEADAIIDQFTIDGLMPKLRQVAKLHDSLVDYMGKEKVKAGLLSKDDWARIRKEQPFYTPLKGFALEGEDMNIDGDPKAAMAEAREANLGSGAGRARIKEFVAARGRKSLSFNPLFNLIADAQFAIARIERNRVAQQLLDNALGDPLTHEGIVKVYSEKKVPNATMLSGEALTAMRQRASDGARKGDQAFVVKKGGDTYYLDFQNTDAGNALYRAFSNMTPKELGAFMTGGDLTINGTKYHVPGLMDISNGIKSLKTRFNPSYLLGTAWQRDFQEAILTNLSAQGVKGGPAEGKKIAARSAQYMFSPTQATVVGNFLTGRDMESDANQEMTLLFDQFLKDGGAVGNSMVMNAADRVQAFDDALGVLKQLQNKRPDKAAIEFGKMGFEFLDAVSQVIDMQARFATYRAALDAGIDRDNAAALALDSSLNLTRRGEWAPVLDTWAFFWSAGFEGGRKFVNQGLTSRNALVTIVAAMKLGILLQLWNWFTGDDDDDDGRKNIYDVSEVTRQNRAVVYYGPGTNDYVALPMAFSLGFAKFAGEEIAAAMLGDKTVGEAAVGVADAFRAMSLPVRGSMNKDLGASAVSIAAPDAFQPFVDLNYNTSFFGSPIYRENKFTTEPRSEQGRADTLRGYEWLAKGMNSITGGTSTVEGGFSKQPEWYEYLVKQYGGGLAGIASSVAEGKGPKLFNIMGKGGEYAPMNNFYRNTTDMDAIYAVYNNEDAGQFEELEQNQAKYPIKSDPRVMEAYGDAQKQLKAIRKDFREGTYGDIEGYHADLNEVYKAFNRTFNDVKREYEGR